MKINELHLRNIASIEAADIDFEHRLVDDITGDPASIFLISGDTGAGKSVILDGIAMALYKKTPRITSVANITKNEFKNLYGEPINVSNISQYTRMGISEKDDCYSEVQFEGNDGLGYRVRLTLGYLRGNTDKQTGLRHLKYRTPEWTLTLPNGTILNKSGDIENELSKVIGLDFEQFERMAMLAQGQFEAFLTGKKEERMVVLEKLTNTEQFKTYGEAIENLFKKAKTEYLLVETKQAEALLNPLATIDVEKLIEEISRLEEEKKALNQALMLNREKLELVKAIEQGEQAQAEAEQKKQRLISHQESSTFKQSMTLVEDWDATNNERQQLVQLQQATAKKANDEQQLEQLKVKFDQLSSDLERQTQKIDIQDDELYQQNLWLEERKECDNLYTRHGEWQLKMRHLWQLKSKQKELSTKLTSTQNITSELQQNVRNASCALETASEAVNEKQKTIDTLSQKRQVLDPAGINEKLSQTLNRKTDLERLQEVLSQLAEKQEILKKTKNEISAEETLLARLKAEKEQLEKAFNKAKTTDDAAKERLTTMKMSLNETLITLRKRLEKEHTETCPLCGQHISQLHLGQDFQNVITPLETEQKQTAEALKLAEEQYHNANNAYLKASGELENKKKYLRQQESQFDEDEQKAKETALQIGLNQSQDYGNQIATLLETIESNLTSLKTAQREAESLQNEINAKLEEKKPLDEKKNQAETALNKAKNAVDQNAKEMEIMQNQQNEMEVEIQSLEAELNKALGKFYPDWYNHPDATSTLFEQEATTYLDKKTKYEKAKNNLASIKEKIKTIRDTRSTLLEVQPKWNTPVQASDFTFHDRIKLWTDLLTQVSAYAKSIYDSERIINNCQSKLNDYYARSGKTQAKLESLIAQAQQVEVFRKEINEHVFELKSSQNAIEQAQRQIETAMAKIGTSQKSDIPQKEALETEEKTMNEKMQDCVSALAQHSKQLIDYKDFDRHLKEVKQELESARQVRLKWEKLNKYFGGSRFRILVQTYILRPLLNNANIYLERITDRYYLTCDVDNEQLSILVLDRYNKNQVRSVTVLSGGERFMISLALSLALSSLNRPDLNVNILFIDEGFGTLDKENLESVIETLEKLQEIAGQSNRRVGIISHREELEERIPVKIKVEKHGEGRSQVKIENSI